MQFLRGRRCRRHWQGHRPRDDPDVGAPLATRVLCAGRGVWCSYRPKFEIGVVELLARKRKLAIAPGTTGTRPLGGRTEMPEFGDPSKSRTSRFRAVNTPLGYFGLYGDEDDHRAPVGQGPRLPRLARALGVWYWRALATGTAWAGLCLIHHHQSNAGYGYVTTQDGTSLIHRTTSRPFPADGESHRQPQRQPGITKRPAKWVMMMMMMNYTI